MDHSVPFNKDEYIKATIDEIMKGLQDQAARDKEKAKLMVVQRVLIDYRCQGKTIEDFEKEYGCSLIYEEMSGGIKGVRFHNDSNETMFMLKYNT